MLPCHTFHACWIFLTEYRNEYGHPRFQSPGPYYRGSNRGRGRDGGGFYRNALSEQRENFSKHQFDQNPFYLALQSKLTFTPPESAPSGPF